LRRPRGLPSFPASDKCKDTRYDWFVRHHGKRCWEIDALDPNILRACVEQAIKLEIDLEEWQRLETVSKAERDSLREVLTRWSKPTESLRAAGAARRRLHLIGPGNRSH